MKDEIKGGIAYEKSIRSKVFHTNIIPQKPLQVLNLQGFFRFYVKRKKLPLQSIFGQTVRQLLLAAHKHICKLVILIKGLNEKMMIKLNNKDKMIMLNHFQIENSELKIINQYMHSSSLESEESFSEKDIEILLKYPWILLQACTTFFYDFLYEKDSEENWFCEVMYFSENELNDCWMLVKKLFRKTTFFRTNIMPENMAVCRVDVTGISEYGKKALEILDKKGAIPLLWKKLYLVSNYPHDEEEGVYLLTNTDKSSEVIQKDDIMNQLINTSYFTYMDISTLSLNEYEDNEIVRTILSKKSKAIIFVEKDDTVFHIVLKEFVGSDD